VVALESLTKSSNGAPNRQRSLRWNRPSDVPLAFRSRSLVLFLGHDGNAEFDPCLDRSRFQRNLEEPGHGVLPWYWHY
jgi:hypothetical protein